MKWLSFALAFAVGLMPAVALAAEPVDPSSVTLSMKPGESTNVTTHVTTAEIPSTPDIYFLADSTGSMGSAIAAAQSGATSIMSAITAIDANARFGVGDYKDVGDVYCFNNGQSITGDSAAVNSAMAAWLASGGGDWPEGQLGALYKIATDPAIGWRSNSTRIVIMFGDAPGNDPILGSAIGAGSNVTEAMATDALVDAGIIVIAVSTNGGGLDAYGQASRIAAATGGIYRADIQPAELVDTILGSLSDVTTDISATIDADPGLTITLNPSAHTGVATGTTVDFAEKIDVASDVTTTTLHATVTFLAGEAEIGKQTITVNLPAKAAASSPTTATPGLPATGIGPDQPSRSAAPIAAIALLAFAGLAHLRGKRKASSAA